MVIHFGSKGWMPIKMPNAGINKEELRKQHKTSLFAEKRVLDNLSIVSFGGVVIP
jgi:hypothetical protein